MFDLQLFGGRGAGSGGGVTGGLDSNDIVSRDSLISQRGEKRQEVDDVLNVLRDARDQYGAILTDVQTAVMTPEGQSTMAFYDADGNVAINQNYFDEARIAGAYDENVASGFHPSRGNKSAIEAVTAHEVGHKITEMAGENAGYGSWALDRVANEVVKNASRATGQKHDDLRKSISGYAMANNAETLAEAFADVYCNGNKASNASRAIVTELNKYFRG